VTKPGKRESAGSPSQGEDKMLDNDQDERNAGGGASGAGSSQGDGIGAAAASLRAADPEKAPDAQAGADTHADKPAAGTEDKTNPPAAWDHDEIVWHGQKVKMTRQEIIDHAQRAYNVTQGEQANSKTRKELTEKLTQLNELIEEARKSPDHAEADGDPIAVLRKEIDELKEVRKLEAWDKYFSPVKAKHPDIPEDFLVSKFQARVLSKEVENTEEGLMKTADDISNGFSGTVDKRIEALLNDATNPKIKAHNDKVVAAYLAEKQRLANSGGEKGAGISGGAEGKVKTISETAAELRAG